MVIWKREGPPELPPLSGTVSGPHLPDLVALTLKPFLLVGTGLSTVPGPECVSFPALGGSGVLWEHWGWGVCWQALGGLGLGRWEGHRRGLRGLGSVPDAHGTA